MSKTFQQLYQQCDDITNEKEIGGNTKEEVGGLFHDIVEKTEDVAGHNIIIGDDYDDYFQD